MSVPTSVPFTSTKTYRNLPCAHRQWKHGGHCSFVHGYSRSFTFVFGARELDETHFVVDFGQLKDLKAWLDHMFDHTLLLCEDDPELPLFRELEARGACALRTLPNVSMEGTAKVVFDKAEALIADKTGGRAWVVSVECRENDKNSAVYRPPRGPDGALLELP